MNAFFSKAIVLLLIFIGEGIAIYAEIFGAKRYTIINETFLGTFLQMLIIIMAGSALLICGYMLGYRTFKNIWIVSATSITSILIIEPTINYALFHELPTRGSLVGLIFGFLGIVATLSL